MADSAELIARVRDALGEAPYAVLPTPDGFDVVIDLAGVGAWHEAAYGISETMVYHVELDEAGRRFAVTDEQRSVEWEGGVGRFGAGRSVASGRVVEYSFDMGPIAFIAGRPVGAWWFHPEAVRKRVVEAVEADGWRKRMGGAQKAGLIVALVCGGIPLLIALVFALLYLAPR